MVPSGLNPDDVGGNRRGLTGEWHDSGCPRHMPVVVSGRPCDQSSACLLGFLVPVVFPPTATPPVLSDLIFFDGSPSLAFPCLWTVKQVSLPLHMPDGR